MKPSIKTDYVLFALLILLVLIFRLPYTSELGTDGFIHHILANSISDYGHVKWGITPLSMFGYYPSSYPCGAYIILSAISQCLNIDMSFTILILGIVLGILGIFSSFLFGYEIKKSFTFAFFVAFSFSISPYFLIWTRGQMSGRILFVSLIPIVFCLVLRFHKSIGTEKVKNSILIIILLTLMALLHRMIILLLLLLIAAYPLVLIIMFLNEHCDLTITKKLRNYAFLLSLILFSGAFLVQYSGIYIYEGIWEDYQTGIFFKGSSPVILALNAGTNYLGSIGIITIMGIFGLLLLLRKQNKTFNEIFVIITLLLLTSFLALGLYISLFLIIFVGVLSALSLEYLLKEETQTKSLKRVNSRLLFLMSFFIISVAFSGFMIIHRTNLTIGVQSDTYWISDSTSNAAIFLKSKGGNGSFYSNGGLTSYRVAAISGKKFFIEESIGTALYAIMSNTSRETLKGTLINFSEITYRTDYLYKPKEPFVVRNLWWRTISDAVSIEIITDFDIKYAVEDVRAKGMKIWSYGYATSKSNFFESLSEGSNLVYDNGKVNIWYLIA